MCVENLRINNAFKQKMSTKINFLFLYYIYNVSRLITNFSLTLKNAKLTNNKFFFQSDQSLT